MLQVCSSSGASVAFLHFPRQPASGSAAKDDFVAELYCGELSSCLSGQGKVSSSIPGGLSPSSCTLAATAALRIPREAPASESNYHSSLRSMRERTRVSVCGALACFTVQV